MDLKKAEKTLNELEENSIKVKQVGKAIDKLKEIQDELESLPEKIEEKSKTNGFSKMFRKMSTKNPDQSDNDSKQSKSTKGNINTSNEYNDNSPMFESNTHLTITVINK